MFCLCLISSYHTLRPFHTNAVRFIGNGYTFLNLTNIYQKHFENWQYIAWSLFLNAQKSFQNHFYLSNNPKFPRRVSKTNLNLIWKLKKCLKTFLNFQKYVFILSIIKFGAFLPFNKFCSFEFKKHLNFQKHSQKFSLCC